VSDPSDYRVGYGRPPLETRWRKGQSSNHPRQRPKPPESLVATIDRLLRTPLQITVNGETKRLSALEAIIMQLVQKSMSGNRRASRVLLKYQEFANRNTEKTLELTFADNDYTRAFSGQRTGADHE
jgi:Family of unknown function (DUF5681)